MVGDDWFRSNDSRFFGPISIDNIEGKVLGVIAVQRR
ncbi:S26 family signal peptidase [Paenibacillus lautus]